MPKIRDLGINAIPEKGPRPEEGLDGLFAACPQPSQCPGQSGCPGQSHCEACTMITEPCIGCTQPGTVCNQPSSSNIDEEKDKKRKALTHEAIAQLQHQMQQKVAAVTEAGAG
jgi:Ni,Fe-hydrogenase I small subunit